MYLTISSMLWCPSLTWLCEDVYYGINLSLIWDWSSLDQILTKVGLKEVLTSRNHARPDFWLFYTISETCQHFIDKKLTQLFKHIQCGIKFSQTQCSSWTSVLHSCKLHVHVFEYIKDKSYQIKDWYNKVSFWNNSPFNIGPYRSRFHASFNILSVSYDKGLNSTRCRTGSQVHYTLLEISVFSSYM